jgi:hypothetical protein
VDLNLRGSQGLVRMEESRIVTPVELGAQAGTAKLLSPCTQGPPDVGNHLFVVSEPSRRSTRGEIRDPKPDGASLEPLKGQDCKSRARRGPSEISIP